MEGYQHAINQEVRSKKRNKKLKLVLLGVFRDTCDIFELEWLTRMQSECPELQVHFIVKSNAADGPLPVNCTMEPLAARPLMRLLPKKDLHSIMVCGSHSFKHNAVKLLNKSGLPRSSITPV
jgi:ferredoxin-NADP reductase